MRRVIRHGFGIPRPEHGFDSQLRFRLLALAFGQFPLLLRLGLLDPDPVGDQFALACRIAASDSRGHAPSGMSRGSPANRLR
jgi:hypothetical protein